jgi:hypothetical protein
MIGIATLERGLIAGLLLLLIGMGLAIASLVVWETADYGPISPGITMRLVIPSATLILLAFQTAYGSLFLSVLEVRSTKSDLTGRPRQ